MSANTSAPNRASLLAGLRTGGVRSNIPHTAAPGGTFNIPRVPSHLQSSIFPEEDDQPAQFAQNVFVNHGANRTMPMTAAVDGPNNRFMQQQRDQNPNIGSFSPAFAAQPNHVQAQALQMQMQMMQLAMQVRIDCPTLIVSLSNSPRFRPCRRSISSAAARPEPATERETSQL
jgi:hypothetical protein